MNFAMLLRRARAHVAPLRMRTQLVVTARTRAVLPYMTPKRFLGNPNYSSGPQEPRDPVIIQPIHTYPFSMCQGKMDTASEQG